MDLIGDLSKETWADKGSPPMDPSKVQNYRRYSVFRRHVEEQDETCTYYLKTDNGEPLKVTLSGVATKRDPLKDINNAYLKLDKKNENEATIEGIILDTDWVEIKAHQ